MSCFLSQGVHFEKLYPEPHAQLTLPHLLLLPETTATCTVLHPLSLMTTPPQSGDHPPTKAVLLVALCELWVQQICKLWFLSLDLHPSSPNHTQGNKVIWLKCCCCSVTKSCLALPSRWLQHSTLPCPSRSPWFCSDSCPLSQWCHPTISSSLIPFFSCPQSFPASGPGLYSLEAGMTLPNPLHDN